jgi:hypothetical protein
MCWNLWSRQPALCCVLCIELLRCSDSLFPTAERNSGVSLWPQCNIPQKVTKFEPIHIYLHFYQIYDIVHVLLIPGSRSWPRDRSQEDVLIRFRYLTSTNVFLQIIAFYRSFQWMFPDFTYCYCQKGERCDVDVASARH